MRVLKFNVDGQVITIDPTGDFDGMFPGKENKVEVEFAFSTEWESMIKVAAFWSILGNEYPPQVLTEYDTCMIPEEALSKPAFKIQLFGKRRGVTLRTNTVTVYQRGGAK